MPVNTVLSGFLATPGVGVGIYDREGVTVGTSYTRTYTFMRTSGGGGTTTYNLTLGRQRRHLQLGRLDRAAAEHAGRRSTCTINPATAGAHSAILNLDDPSTAGIDYQTMNIVVAADEFTRREQLLASRRPARSGATRRCSYFFHVPAGTPAFKVDFTGPSATPGTGQARFLRFHPYGVGDRHRTRQPDLLQRRRPACATGSPTQPHDHQPAWRASGRSRSRRGAPRTPPARRSR